MNDVYYSPENFDLTPVAELELCGESYSFDIIAVWKHKDGKVYMAVDSGCSCPSPFENYHSVESLTQITSLDECKKIVKEANYPSPLDKKEFLKKVKAALTK